MTYLEAIYADGYIHSERELNDQSPYLETANIFSDILNKRPEPDHGRLVEFALVHNGQRHAIDWTKLPDNARPIRYKQMEHDFNPATGPGQTRMVGIGFGYQYTDPSGNNVQKVLNL